MELSFRHGIVRHQTDSALTANFVRKNGSDSSFIDLICDNGPFIITIAHGNANYLVEIDKTLTQAWGPMLAQGQTQYLYCDINLIDTSLSFGFTELPPIVATAAPLNPALDQHWFDKVSNMMRVWNGTKWIIKLRVFTATYDNNATLVPRTIGSQVGLNSIVKAGRIVSASDGFPLFNTDGTFITSESSLLMSYSNSELVKLEAAVVYVEAVENIPAYSVVTFDSPRKIKVALPVNNTLRICGIVQQPLSAGETAVLTTTGSVTNTQWDFSNSDINKPVFVSTSGEISLLPSPNQIGEIGYVYDNKSIFLDIKHQPSILGGGTATKTSIGLGNVDNTSDVNKPISSAQQMAINLKANIADPIFTGHVTVPAPTVGTDAVTKAYVDNAVTASTVTFGSLTGKPTSIAGYGITDAFTKSEIASQLSSKVDNSHVYNLDDLGDVSIVEPLVNEIISFDGTNWINAAAPITGATQLNELDDVNVLGAVDGELLSFDFASNKWIPSALPPKTSTLSFEFDCKKSPVLYDDNGIPTTNTVIYDFAGVMVNAAPARFLPAGLSYGLSYNPRILKVEENSTLYAEGNHYATISSPTVARGYELSYDSNSTPVVNSSISNEPGLYTTSEFSIRRNGIEIILVTFPEGSLIGNISFTNNQTINLEAGEFLEVWIKNTGEQFSYTVEIFLQSIIN